MTTKCEHVRDDLSAYLDGQISPEERERIEKHLATCPSCREELEQMRRLVLLLRSTPQVAPPRSFTLTPQRAQPRGLLQMLTRMAPFVSVASAAALVLLLTLDLFAARPARQQPALSLPPAQAFTVTTAPITGAAPQLAAVATEAPGPSAEIVLQAAKQATAPAAVEATNTPAAPLTRSAPPETPPQPAPLAADGQAAAPAEAASPESAPAPRSQAASACAGPPVVASPSEAPGVRGLREVSTPTEPTKVAPTRLEAPGALGSPTALATASLQASPASASSHRQALALGGNAAFRLGELGAAALLAVSLGLWRIGAQRGL